MPDYVEAEAHTRFHVVGVQSDPIRLKISKSVRCGCSELEMNFYTLTESLGFVFTLERVVLKPVTVCQLCFKARLTYVVTGDIEEYHAAFNKLRVGWQLANRVSGYTAD